MTTPAPSKPGRLARLRSADLALAMRNVFRQKARTALTVLIIAAGVAGLILSGGFVAHALDGLRETTIHSQLGHLQIYRKGYFANGKQHPFQYLIDRPDEITAIVGRPEVDASMLRLGFAAVLNNGRTDYAVFGEGIEPQKEAVLGKQVRLVAGRMLEQSDRFSIVVGEGVATSLALAPGAVVTLLLSTEEGALNNLGFTVVGVFRTFSKDYDAHAVRIALPDAQELLSSRAVNAVVVALKDTSQTDRVAALLAASLDSGRYEIKTWHELADFYEQTAALFKRQFAFLQCIILISVLLSVANSVNMTIFERTGEFGTLMALGTRRRAILRLVLLESALVGLIGSGLGIVLGLLLAWIVNALHIPLPPPPNSNSGYFAGIRIDAALLSTAFIVGFVTTPLTALIPARRISRIAVVDALRLN